MSDSLYETDFYTWTLEQAKLLHYQKWDSLDLSNLIEEIESLGKQQRQELRNRLGVLIGHLLKWHFQTGYRSRSWLVTIRLQRRAIVRLLQDSPSLKSYLQEALQESYENGRDLASGETNLPFNTFPSICPYSLAEIFNHDFFPGEPGVDEFI